MAKRKKRSSAPVEFILRSVEPGPARRQEPESKPPAKESRTPAPSVIAPDPNIASKLHASEQAMGSLRAELDTVKHALESKDTFIAEQLASITENLEGIQVISELVSTRYNPFLDENEQIAFAGEDRMPMAILRKLGALGTDGLSALAASNGRSVNESMGALTNSQRPAASSPAPYEESAAARYPHHLTEDEEPMREHAPILPDEARHGRAERQRPRALESSEHAGWLDRVMREFDDDPRPTVEAHLPESPRLAKRRMERAVGGPRETFMALHWLEEMARRVDPSIIYLCLDHYHQMDWIDPEVYDWLTGLAEGIVARDHGAKWASYDITPTKLLEIHQSNLLFLSDLFSEKLRPEERRVLGQTVRTYFEAI